MAFLSGREGIDKFSGSRWRVRPSRPADSAMTHAERVLPRYLAELEHVGLTDVDVIIRMAGCPNSCSRPPTAEIGIVGYGKE